MKLPSLTIGRTIVSGFAFVFALFAVVAGLAYFALGRASQGLSQFSTSTVETNLAGSLESSMLSLRMTVSEYLAKSTDVPTLQKAVGQLSKDLTVAKDSLKKANTAIGEQNAGLMKLREERDDLKKALKAKDEEIVKLKKTPADSQSPRASLIKGVVCGVRVEDVEDPLMQKIRYLDKLVDELAKGKAMEKILR